jgi:hypothetical protein
LDLPFLLAGPQLRRVTPTEVTVWMLFSAACDADLFVYKGIEEDHGNAPSFTHSAQSILVGSAHASTFPMGAKLHVAIIHLVLNAANALVPGTLYSYDVRISGAVSAVDLKGLGLLSDAPAQGIVPARLALGYKPGRLPAFVAAPAAKDLRVVHGSCRKASGLGADALARVDFLIQGALDNPLARPHQLLLTGDQIYADDVPLPLSPALTELGAALVTGGATTTERLPVRLGGQDRLVSIDQVNFPAGMRRRLTKQAISSLEADCHLLAFGEYAAMYVLAWSLSCWPLITVPDSAGAFAARRGPMPVNLILSEVDPGGTEGAELPSEKVYAAKYRCVMGLLKGVPYVARAMANTPTFMMLDDHEVTDDWNRTRHWQKKAFGTDPKEAPQGGVGRAVVRNALTAYAFFQDTGNAPADYASPTSPKRAMLIQALPMMRTQSDADWNAFAAKLDAALGIGVGAEPAFAWEHAVTPAGPEHDIFFLDTRTRRLFRSDESPPYLLSPKAIAGQLPGFEAHPDRLTFVVSPGNVVSDARLAWIQRLGGRDVSGADEMDREAWDEEATSLAVLFEQLAARSRVVILSGDVHHAFTTAVDYFEPTRRRTILQLVSSGVRNWERGFGGGLVMRTLKLGVQGDNVLRSIYESRSEELGFTWKEHNNGNSVKLAEMLAARAGVRRFSTTPSRGAGFAEPGDEIARSWPPLLERPAAYWRAHQLLDAKTLRTLGSATADAINVGVTSMFFWRNNIGLVTFGPDPTRITHTLLGAPVELEGRDVPPLEFEWRFSSADPDPLGFGW